MISGELTDAHARARWCMQTYTYKYALTHERIQTHYNRSTYASPKAPKASPEKMRLEYLCQTTKVRTRHIAVRDIRMHACILAYNLRYLSVFDVRCTCCNVGTHTYTRDTQPFLSCAGGGQGK
jgi:hypothetical protein